MVSSLLPGAGSPLSLLLFWPEINPGVRRLLKVTALEWTLKMSYIGYVVHTYSSYYYWLYSTSQVRRVGVVVVSFAIREKRGGGGGGSGVF